MQFLAKPPPTKVEHAAPSAITLRDVRKVYGEGDSEVVALDGVSVGFAPGWAPIPHSYEGDSHEACSR
jgi:hypothetical protein